MRAVLVSLLAAICVSTWGCTTNNSTNIAVTPATHPLDFDRQATATALMSIDVNTCKSPDGPTGKGHLTITFATNGTVAHAEIDQPPYAGTGVGDCIAAKFYTVRVPPFGGTAVSVGKAFFVR